MCRKATCKSCQKPTWKGCGAHVEQVLGDVAPDDRCDCAGSASSGSGFFSTLLGR